MKIRSPRRISSLVILVTVLILVFGSGIIWFGLLRGYLHDHEIVSEVQDLGGTVSIDYFGPEWLVSSPVIGKWTARIIAIDLSSTETNDHALKRVGTLNHLEELYLENTKITDAGLVYLQSVETLSFIDLYGTDISDRGLVTLGGFTDLGEVMLGQNNTTSDGVLNFQARNPDVFIEIEEP